MKDYYFYGLLSLYVLIFIFTEVLTYTCSVDNCKECKEDNSNACTICNDGYWLDNKKCTQCPNNCLTCTSNQTCNSCNKNFNLTNGSCICNLTGCVSCSTEKGKCLTCDTNYQLIDGVCKCSEPNCKICSKNDKCLECDNNFLLNEDNHSCYCKEPNCAQCSSTKKCTQCKINHEITSNQNCNCLLNNCITCSTEEEKVCLECDVNFIPNDNGKCICNLSHCAECSNVKNKCKTCKNNFVLDNNNSCICNLPNCESCSDNIDNKCEECKETFIMKNGTCPCYDRNCLECDSPLYGTCKKCNNNLNLTNEGTCVNDSIPNCLYYNDKSCDYCEFGYSLKDDTCIPQSVNCTIVGCKECYSQNGEETCIDCNDGYTLEHGKCTQNPECDLFVNNICIHCPGDYFNLNSTCFLKCKGADCDTDKINNTCKNTCIKCEKNSLIEIPNCKPKNYCTVNNCAMCFKKEECIRCDVGYGLFDNQCVECPDFCLHCDHDKKCKSCINRYILENGICLNKTSNS